MGLTLDVGCGSEPKADVNVDLYGQKGVANFVQADGCHLPFRIGSFESVISCHVIEHTVDPVLFFKELVRVSQKTVSVEFPHRLGDVCGNWKRSNRSPHLHRFNVAWFKALSRKLGLVLVDERVGYRHFPFISNNFGKYLGFVVRLPASVRLTFRKPQL